MSGIALNTLRRGFSSLANLPHSNHGIIIQRNLKTISVANPKKLRMTDRKTSMTFDQFKATSVESYEEYKNEIVPVIHKYSKGAEKICSEKDLQRAYNAYCKNSYGRSLNNLNPINPHIL